MPFIMFSLISIWVVWLKEFMSNLMKASFAKIILALFFLASFVGAASAQEAPESACKIPPLSIVHVLPFTPVPPALHFINTSEYPHAMCNDGSPAAYLFRPSSSSGSASKRWVIHLQGGGQCAGDDKNIPPKFNCQYRLENTPDRVSSTFYQAEWSAGKLANDMGHGILSSDPNVNPDFYDANLVEILYCSSDLWSGDKDGSPFNLQSPTASTSWYYHGRAIVDHVFEDLWRNYNLKNANEVLLSGTSAGGDGVFVLQQDAFTRLAAARPSLRFLAAPDAAFEPQYPDFDAATAGFVSAENGTKLLNAGIQLWNGRGDSTCEADRANPAYPGYKNISAADCYNGNFMTHKPNMIAAPLFVRQSEEDENRLSDKGVPLTAQLNSTYDAPAYNDAGVTPYIFGGVSNDTEMAGFAPTLQASLATAKGNVSVMGVSSSLHTMFVNDDYFNKPFPFYDNTKKLVDVSVAEALGTWYRAPCERAFYIQTPSLGLTLQQSQNPDK